MARYVYFIESGFGGPIKIGSARNPLSRLRSLQTGNPEELHLLAMVEEEGSISEVGLQDRFRKHQISNEWFAPHSDVWELVNKHWCYDAANGKRRHSVDVLGYVVTEVIG